MQKMTMAMTAMKEDQRVLDRDYITIQAAKNELDGISVDVVSVSAVVKSTADIEDLVEILNQIKLSF